MKEQQAKKSHDTFKQEQGGGISLTLHQKLLETYSNYQSYFGAEQTNRPIEENKQHRNSSIDTYKFDSMQMQHCRSALYISEIKDRNFDKWYTFLIEILINGYP